MTDTRTSNSQLGPKDHLCQKCGEYVICDNDDAFVEIIERLTRELASERVNVEALRREKDEWRACWQSAEDDAEAVRPERDRLRAALEQMIAWFRSRSGSPEGMRRVSVAEEALGPADEDKA